MSQLVRERIQRAEGRHTSGWGMGTGVSLRGAELPGMGTQARAVCRQELLGPAPSCLCLARLREASEDALDKARVSRGSLGLSRSKAASPFRFRNSNHFHPFWTLGRRVPLPGRSFLKPELVWVTFGFTKTPEKPFFFSC